jgi:hypothetical protein
VVGQSNLARANERNLEHMLAEPTVRVSRILIRAREIR